MPRSKGRVFCLLFNKEDFDQKEGVYKKAVILRRALLREQDSANPFASLAQITKGKKAMDTKLEILSEILGDETLARSVLEEAQELSDSLREERVEFRSKKTRNFLGLKYIADHKSPPVGLGNEKSS